MSLLYSGTVYVTAAKEKVEINVEGLPEINEILESIGFSEYSKRFSQLGVRTTRELLRLDTSDYTEMEFEWEMTDQEQEVLKKKVAELLIEAMAAFKPPIQVEDYGERNKAKFGKILLAGSVQSYDYEKGDFGGAMPLGQMEVHVLSFSLDACADVQAAQSAGDEDESVPPPPPSFSSSSSSILSGKALLALQGNCTFFEKAQFARARNASMLIIAFTNSSYSGPSSGAHVNRNITEAMLQAVLPLAVVSVANSSYTKLAHAAQKSQERGRDNYPAVIRTIPILCERGTCAPPLAREQAIVEHITGGEMYLKKVAAARQGLSSQKQEQEEEEEEVEYYCDFLTSDFGSSLPTIPPPVPSSSSATSQVYVSQPVDGCLELEWPRRAYPILPPNVSRVLIMHRGGCPFHEKLLNAQAVGADFVVFVNYEHEALLRVGATEPFASHIAIPSVMVTSECGKFLTSMYGEGANIAASAGAGVNVDGAGESSQQGAPAQHTLSVSPHLHHALANRWVEIADKAWSEVPAEQIIQIHMLLQSFLEDDTSGAAEVAAGELFRWLKARVARLQQRL